MKNKLMLILAIGLLIGSCNKEIQTEQKGLLEEQLNESIVLMNTPEQLSQHLLIKNELVPIREIASTGTKSSPKQEEKDLNPNYAFQLVAEVKTPHFGKKTLQATHVKIVGHHAFVSYNTQGDEYLGGVDVFNVMDPGKPKLISRAILPHIDISALDYHDGKLVLCGAIEMDVFDHTLTSPAVLISLFLDTENRVDRMGSIIDLPSYVGTDVVIEDELIYVTSGSDGALIVLNTSLETVQEIAIADARSISINQDKVFVLDGENSQIRSFLTSDFTEKEPIVVNGPITPESKTKIVSNEQYILAALNEGGMDFCLSNGELKQHFDRPSTPEERLDEDYVTNSVSLNEDLVLIGNGGAGVYVGAMIEENEDEINLLGSMDFHSSVNFAESKEDLIFVASGTGGLKIITIRIDEGLPGEIIPSKPCETLINNIISMFPNLQDNKSAHPDLFAPDAAHKLKLTQESPVYVTFIDEDAGWRNSLAYYSYDADTPPESVDNLELNMVFPNISKEHEGGGLKTGDKVQLGEDNFPANTVIGFCLIVQGWKNGTTTDGIYSHFTDTWLNVDHAQQHVLFQESNCGDLVICFEDKQLADSDRDFNDILFTISDNAEDTTLSTAFDLSDVVAK